MTRSSSRIKEQHLPTPSPQVLQEQVFNFPKTNIDPKAKQEEDEDKPKEEEEYMQLGS